jgi:hypothetical protein
MNNDFILDGFTWSFSKLDTYITCPKMFKDTYIDGTIKEESNAFAEFGTFGHKILEKYYRGEFEIYELGEIYEKHYNKAVISKFPRNPYTDLNTTYYEAGKIYFDNFSGEFDKFTVLGVEEQFETEIEGYKFTGIIDLILQDPVTNDITVVDHKSMSKKSKKVMQYKYHQLYIYAKYIHDKFGEYPSNLIFNLYRILLIDEHKFDYEKYQETCEWCKSTIETIYKDNEFESRPSKYWCENICSVRNLCADISWDDIKATYANYRKFNIEE